MFFIKFTYNFSFKIQNKLMIKIIYILYKLQVPICNLFNYVLHLFIYLFIKQKIQEEFWDF